jgi:hypothetical protein
VSGAQRGRAEIIAEKVADIATGYGNEIRAFRIYDGPTQVHKWSLARTIKRNWKATCS